MSTPQEDAFDHIKRITLSLLRMTHELATKYPSAKWWLQQVEARAKREWFEELDPHFAALRKWAKLRKVERQVKTAIEELAESIKRVRSFIPRRTAMTGGDDAALHPDCLLDFEPLAYEQNGVIERLKEIIEDVAESRDVQQSMRGPNKGRYMDGAEKLILGWLVEVEPSGLTRAQIVEKVKESGEFTSGTIDNALGRLVEDNRIEPTKQRCGTYHITDRGRDVWQIWTGEMSDDLRDFFTRIGS